MSVRILHVIKSLGRGGAETLLPETLRLHNRAKFDFSYLYFLPWKNQLVDEIAANGGEVHCMPATNNISILFRARKLASWISRNKIDIVHAHLPWAGIVARLAGRIAGVPVIYTEHNLQERYHPMTRFLNLATLGLQRATVAVSDDVAASVLRSKPGLPNVKTILNGVDTDRFRHNSEQRKEIRRQLGIADEHILIGNIAVFRPQKRLDLWIENAVSIFQRNSSARFVLVGNGPLNDMLTRKRSQLGAEAIIHMPGLKEDVMPYLSALDVFMITSEFEGLPIALLEGMSAGLPVISTDAGGIGQVVRHNIDGYLCNVAEPQHLVNFAGQLIDDQPSRLAMGRAARQRIVDSFSLRTMVTQLESLYEEVLISTHGKRE